MVEFLFPPNFLRMLIFVKHFAVGAEKEKFRMHIDVCELNLKNVLRYSKIFFTKSGCLYRVFI